MPRTKPMYREHLVQEKLVLVLQSQHFRDVFVSLCPVLKELRCTFRASSRRCDLYRGVLYTAGGSIDMPSKAPVQERMADTKRIIRRP